MTGRSARSIGLLFDVFMVQERTGQMLRLALDPIPLKPVEYGILSLLATVGPATPTEISRMTGQPASTLSGYLASLTRRELVRRAPAPADGRSVILVLTGKGRDLHAAGVERVAEYMARLRAEVAVPLEDLRAALHALADGLDRVMGLDTGTTEAGAAR
jgi:DNA-binding MarR family transcriptional regulator